MRFYNTVITGKFLPDAASTRKLGDVGSEFLEVHSDDFFGDITGDVKSANGVACLVSGATPAVSTFAGTAEAAKYSA
jgi:hypothetical protein